MHFLGAGNKIYAVCQRNSEIDFGVISLCSLTNWRRLNLVVAYGCWMTVVLPTAHRGGMETMVMSRECPEASLDLDDDLSVQDAVQKTVGKRHFIVIRVSL